MVILAVIILFLVLFIRDSNLANKYPHTFIVIALTCGILLGWAIGSVLQQVMLIHRVEIFVNVCLCVLSILALIMSAIILVEESRYSQQNFYLNMVGVAVCLVFEAIVCLLMLSWAYYGTVVIVQTR